MNKTHTLKELADMFAYERRKALHNGQSIEGARMLALKHVLDAVGYKLPVDPEREAFDAWLKEQGGTDFMDMKESMFLSWKASRATLAKEPDAKTEPAWIEWNGGPCPIPDTVKRWEYRFTDGFTYGKPSKPSDYASGWEHVASADSRNHIIAYRIIY